ncbi:MAG: phosphate ABC transporter ATP-binding protein [Spirochaetaceae bacterium]|nr:MAG: phosphate ABC transporter ATP-binding protein [Spirochaetaceae bacterium]
MVEKIRVENLSAWYGDTQALASVSLSVHEHEILGIIGPANSGKSSFIRVINRLNDLKPQYKKQGQVFIDDKNIDAIHPEILRKRVGMVFAMPLSLPMSVYENIAFGPKRHGVRGKKELDAVVQRSLEAASLWDEMKDRLKDSALKLSGGQQQRLCIARTLAVQPEVILFDEPCSGLDPVSTARVEETMIQLKEKYTIVLVTNNIKQASRVSDRTAFFLMGELVELDLPSVIFVAPKDKRTEDYVTGRFG